MSCKVGPIDTDPVPAEHERDGESKFNIMLTSAGSFDLESLCTNEVDDDLVSWRSNGGDGWYSNNKLIGLSVVDPVLSSDCDALCVLDELDLLELDLLDLLDLFDDERPEGGSDGLYSLLSTRFIAFFFAECVIALDDGTAFPLDLVVVFDLNSIPLVLFFVDVEFKRRRLVTDPGIIGVLMTLDVGVGDINDDDNEDVEDFEVFRFLV